MDSSPDNGPMPNFSQTDRRHGIRKQALSRGYVSIEELASAFDVSIMTIHRDLDALAEDGWLVKVRGGARVHPSALLDTSVRARSERNNAEKQAIAAQALTHVQPGQVIFLDESTTSLAMTEGLAACAPLTVISNFLPGITRLSNEPSIDLISIGGAYRHGYDAFFGLMAVEAIAHLQADTLFLSTTAINAGMCCYKSEDSVQLKRALMRSSAHKILLADHSKFGLRALYALAPVTDFDLVIVDDGIGAAELAELQASGVAVEVAPVMTAEKAAAGAARNAV
jgi:DeoR/GlpR family transcriptional regulator of sugar metabolism